MKNGKIIFIGGGVGGTGKTTVTLAVVDALIDKGAKITLVETDLGNPDSYRPFKNVQGIDCEICDLADDDGYIKLGNIMEKTDSTHIVVNTAPRIIEHIVKNGEALACVAKALSAEMIMIWPINRQAATLEKLKYFISSELSNSFAGIYVAKNGYFGTEDKFSLYDGSNLKKNEKIKNTLFFPDLSDAVADKIMNNRLSYGNAESELTMIENIILDKFRRDFKKIFNDIL